MIEGNEIHLQCRCGCHQLHFEKDFEDEMWYGSLWIRGYKETPSWRYKLRCIWQVLKTGRPYGDEVVLYKEDMVELKKYVDSQVKS